jgi:hypothetical protein
MFKKFKTIVILTSIMILSSVFTYAGKVSVWTLNWNLGSSPDVFRSANVVDEGTTVSVLNVINSVNKYLWFAIGFFCFVFAIVNWYKLVSAHWDEKKVKAATWWLIWSIVWIVICISSYLIVNVVLKMFL